VRPSPHVANRTSFGSDGSSSTRQRPARSQEDERHKAGRLKRYAGYVTGYAETFAGALNVERRAIVEAVDGDEPVETEIAINGNRGTDNPGGSTNRIRSDDHDREGVDRVFVALTIDQFRTLADMGGAAVSVS
jgi:hypothetical protein